MQAGKREILLEAGTNEAEFLEFKVYGHHFGVNVHKVLQAVAWKPDALVRVPGASDGYVGEFALRGKPISVVSLKERLRLPMLETCEKPLLLVMEFNQRVTGFIIDEIVNIHRISWTEFTPFDQVARFSDAIDVVGSINISERVVQILDLEATMGRIDKTMAYDASEAEIKESDAFDRAVVRLLYAEDSPTIQRITSRMLKKAGFENITICSTGKEAYEFICTAGDTVDVVLTDIEMPEMDGLTLCRRIREGQHHADLPVIFYSSMINEQMKQKCQSVGGTRSFAKPDISEIVEAIEEVYVEHWRL